MVQLYKEALGNQDPQDGDVLLAANSTQAWAAQTPTGLGRAHLLLLTLVTICINHTSFPAFTLISNSSAKDRLVLGGSEEERKMAPKFCDVYIASYS